MRVHGCTSRIRKMIDSGRFHVHGAAFSFERGRWWVSLHGVAAEFHHVRRSLSPRGDVRRWQEPAGLDSGVKTLAVIATAGSADEDGKLPVPDEMDVLHVVEAVKALQYAQVGLRRANKALSRTKKGSNGRRKARERLTKKHARVAYLRKEASHQLTHWCATHLSELSVEDLNVAGMLKLHTLAKAVADAGMGEIIRQLEYKCAWYGVTLNKADRWFASSKTCSGCGTVKADLTLADRTYRCDGPDGCGLVIDRDVNAAINLARWPLLHSLEAKARLAASAAAAPAPGPAAPAESPPLTRAA